MEGHTIMCLSDVRTFQGSENILQEIKPSNVFLLGDILYDGPGQFYQLDNKKVISGNTHSNKFLEKIHTQHFLDFLEKCITIGVKKIFILPGNHDNNIDYIRIISSRDLPLNRINFIQEPLDVTINEINIFLLPYNYLGKRKLKPFISRLHHSNILMTHGELRHLRYLVDEIYKFHDKKNRVIISGHLGLGYFPPKRLAEALISKNSKLGEKVFSKKGSYLYPQFCSNKNIHILRIDSFPFSFCTLEISNEFVEGKLLYGKINLNKFSFSSFLIERKYKLTHYTNHTSLLEIFNIKL